MAPHNSHILLCVITITISSLCLHGISGVEYEVSNEAPVTPGGKRFTEECGVEGAKELMRESSEFIWSNIFQQNTPETPKPIDIVRLRVVNDHTYKFSTEDNVINISANHVPLKGNVRLDFKIYIYTTMTTVLQWGEDKCPDHLVGGIGWYRNTIVKLFPELFPEPGDGDSWDQVDYVTARFLEYCDEVTPGFVAKLNEKLKETYDESYFKELTGKSVHELWKDYKAKYPEY